MRIYTRGGDLAFKTFVFSDGQPHFKLETYDREFNDVTIETAIKSPSDLFMVVLASTVLRDCGYVVALDIRYLLGARMDRAIGFGEPFTLGIVARLLNAQGFSRVRILDAHSDVAIRQIHHASNVLPKRVVQQILATLGDVDVVVPDKGARPRVAELMVGQGNWIHFCSKERDMATGALSKFVVPSEGIKGRDLLIIDDICDGGGTFVGLAAKLREAGAKSVKLFVTHGIFSKGFPLEGIDLVFTTDSYCDVHAHEHLIRYRVLCPISMKDM